MNLRERRVRVLREAHGVADIDFDGPPVQRYAAVTGAGEYEDAHLSTHPALEDAFDAIGDEVLEGLAPDGVYDLDTGAKIDVHIARPVVTASVDQGVTFNPLEASRERVESRRGD